MRLYLIRLLSGRQPSNWSMGVRVSPGAPNLKVYASEVLVVTLLASTQSYRVRLPADAPINGPRECLECSLACHARNQPISFIGGVAKFRYKSLFLDAQNGNAADC